MICLNCQSMRMAFVSAKCSDLCGVSIMDKNYDGYVPNDLGIGGGDYIRINFCLDCGQLNGNWPLPKSDLELDFDGEDYV